MAERAAKEDINSIYGHYYLEYLPEVIAEQEFYNQQVQTEIDIFKERLQLERQLLELQGDTAAIRALERAALDESNRALYDQITALQDTQAAAQAAADAEAQLAAERERIAQERAGLERQLLELQGDTAAIRALERTALDESNRALYDQITALQDSQAAAAEATRLQNEYANAMANAGRTVAQEIERLRGLTQPGRLTAAQLQAQFAVTTAQARAGDSEALSRLPAISAAIEEAARASATSASQVTRMRASLATSLTETLQALGLDLPTFAAGGLHAGGLRLVGEQGPELEVTGPARYWSAADTMSMLGNSGRRDEVLVAEIRALRTEVANLRAEARATAENTGKTKRLMERVTRDGESLLVTDVTPAP